MREPTDRAVNRAAISSMMMPTGTLWLRPIKAKIQPLPKTKCNKKTVNAMKTGCTVKDVKND